MRKNKLGLFFVLLLAALFLLVIKNSIAASLPAVDPNADAIGVRIIPNPNHYSISRWYNSQGFTGSPQELIVDGYDAIRDGRTVYVNAANIKGKSIYTNIYLISYNQDPSQKTVDILGQIVKNWQFNNDLVEQSNPAPTCIISSLACSSDTDCSSQQYCAASSIASSSCMLKTTTNCLTDDDCPQDFFCNSVKAKIIRDVKRVGKILDLNEALAKYKNLNGTYPKLSAGTYLSGQTVSVWPSWSDEFLTAIPMTANFVDPINRLGACPGYDVKTCWNKDTKKFVYDSTSGNFMLPPGSFGFVYRTDEAGSNYSLCAVMETRESNTTLSYQFSPNNPASSNCITAIGVTAGGTATNTAPYIVDAYLQGESDQPFNGFIKIVDSQGDFLNWSLNTSGESWTGWSAAPVLSDTNNINQKKIYALKAGGPKSYNIQLTVSDGRGGILNTTTPLTIINPKPFIEADNGEFSINPANSFVYSYYFSDNNFADASKAVTITKISGASNFDMLGFTNTTSLIGTNRYQSTYRGKIPTTQKFYANSDYTYRIKVTDKYNGVTTKDLKITLKPEFPDLNFNCLSNSRLGQSYSCFLGFISQNNHQLVYSSSQLPVGFNISIASTSVFLIGTTTERFSSDVSIKAENEYGASTTKAFSLNVNNYCGDGKKQIPNSEGSGGIYNDGYEDCDGISGLSLNTQGLPTVSTSSALQYGCSTYNLQTPYPIPNNNYCVYKSPTGGGGFCGDGYCQLKINVNGVDILVEDQNNCPADCSPTCTPNCNGKVCGDDGCGGSCGTCTTICGDGKCEAGETFANCPLDCTPTGCCQLPAMNDCAGYLDESTCGGDVRCNWDPGHQLGGPGYQSIAACVSKSNFSPSCNNITNANACNNKKNTDGCVWNGAMDGCYTPDPALTPGSCSDGVSLTCTNCVKNLSCVHYQDKDSCEMHQCIWHAQIQ